MSVSRRTLEIVCLCTAMVGLGAGIGVIWTAAITMQAAPDPAPLWATGLSDDYRQLTLVSGAALLVGSLGFVVPTLRGGGDG